MNMAPTPNLLLNLQKWHRWMIRAVQEIWAGMTRITTVTTTAVATTLLRHTIRNSLSVFIVASFIGGLTVFHHSANFKQLGWQNAYYLWEKGLWVLVAMVLFSNVAPKFRLLVVTTIVYTILRLCFQIITTINGIDTNSDTIVNTLYLTLVVIFIIQFIKELLNAWKRQN